MEAVTAGMVIRTVVTAAVITIVSTENSKLIPASASCHSIVIILIFVQSSYHLKKSE